MEVDRPPVWLMRQAGRYLSEYRQLREKYDFLTSCTTPEVAIEISLQPWRRFKMDAVIVFSDILLPAAAMGSKLSFEKGVGPKFDCAVRTQRDIDRLQIPDPEEMLAPTLQALSLLRRELGDKAALIGFIGAPWTIAAYLVQGGSGDFQVFLQMAEKEPILLQSLLKKLTDLLFPYAEAQVRAGADAIQIFDTWGGLLNPADYAEMSLPSVIKICKGIASSGAHSILFVRDSDQLIETMLESRADVVSVGPTLPLRRTHEKIQKRAALQGNLDPEVLLSPSDIVRKKTAAMLASVAGCRGYIANLGHGVLPETSPDAVAAFVETVQHG